LAQYLVLYIDKVLITDNILNQEFRMNDFNGMAGMMPVMAMQMMPA
jgi:hypothetical protein